MPPSPRRVFLTFATLHPPGVVIANAVDVIGNHPVSRPMESRRQLDAGLALQRPAPAGWRASPHALMDLSSSPPCVSEALLQDQQASSCRYQSSRRLCWEHLPAIPLTQQGLWSASDLPSASREVLRRDQGKISAVKVYLTHRDVSTFKVMAYWAAAYSCCAGPAGSTVGALPRRWRCLENQRKANSQQPSAAAAPAWWASSACGAAPLITRHQPALLHGPLAPRRVSLAVATIWPFCAARAWMMSSVRAHAPAQGVAPVRRRAATAAATATVRPPPTR